MHKEDQMQTAALVLERYLDDFSALLKKVEVTEIETLVNLLTEAYKNDRFVFIIGNGGSGANASHLCQDLGKGTLHDLTSRSGSR